MPCVTAHNERNKRYTRTGLPLRLWWALTVHKAQGLTCPESVLVDLTTARPGRNPVATAGLAFVAWTWTRMAIHSLPPLGDFLVVRQSPDFKRREAFEAWADEACDAYM